jgi:hypothetical protein
MKKPRGSLSRGMARLVPAGLLLAMAGLFMVPAAPALAAPVLTVSPTSGAVGTEVTIKGAVFDSYKGDIITVTFNGAAIPQYSPYQIPDSGSFELPFTIPAATAPGSYIIHVETAVGSSQFSAETVFRVEAPGLSLDVTEGPVGTSVTATGRGFYSGSTVTVYFHNPGEESAGTETADEVGHFQHTFLVPAGIGGEHGVSASNTEGNTAAATFTIIAGVSINVASGGPGDLVHVTGTGFGFRSNIRVSMGTTPVATARSDDHGGFAIDFNVPELTAGPYDVKAEDATGNLNMVSFTVTAGASLSAITGAVGSELTARGSGFEAGGTVTVDFGALRVATVPADANGAFTTTFGVPAVGAGPHTVKISDGTITRQIVYTIESTPPPVPAAVLPNDGATVRTSAYLDWEDVSDPSMPVTYQLQVSGDSGFAALIVNATGLTDSQYSFGVTANLTVGDQPVSYYWRIRAEDAAGNLSEWSAARSFVVSPPPAPTILPTATVPAATTGNGTATILTPAVTMSGTVALDWEPVTNPTGPVTYTIEIADNPDFNEPVLEKAGLTSSDYLLSQVDLLNLKDNVPYYWRVKAVDADGVSGDWSTPATFKVGSSFRFPAWGIWVIAGLGVAAIAFLAFRIGRRTAYGPPD